MPLPSPRGVLFDFGDTLLREGPVHVLAGAAAVLGRARDAGGCRPEELAAAFRGLMADLEPRRQAARLELPPHTVSSLIYEPRGIHFELSPGEVEWVFWAAATTWTVEPGIREVLGLLAGHRVPCGVVSNTMFRAETIVRQLALFDIAPSIRWVITSTEHVVRKPDPRLFALAAQRLAQPPKSLWFVGDSFECDVPGAAGVGMIPIWYRRSGPPHPDAYPAAAVVGSWPEFQRLLEAALGPDGRAA
jgi:putative hydrolase of the HAD superfamily